MDRIEAYDIVLQDLADLAEECIQKNDCETFSRINILGQTLYGMRKIIAKYEQEKKTVSANVPDANA